MIQLQAEREQLRSDLRGEINRLLDNLKYEVDVARARENALSPDVQVAKNQIGDADQAGVGLRALEREAESSRLLLERFMGMLLQIGAEQDVQALFPAARLVSQAYEPAEQSFPRAIPTLMLTLVGGLGLGTLLACAIDYAKNRLFVSAEQVEEATGLPVFGIIPLVNDKSGRGDVSPKLAEGTGSILWEAIGALYTRLLLWNKTENCSVEAGGEIKAVLLTSCHAAEGKSTIALSLARQQALCGRRVIVVDTDFRLSRVSTLTGANNRPGIAEVLAGSATLEEVIQQDRTSGTYVMPAGISEIEHSTMAGSAKIKALLAVLRAEYDLVIIDTIPIMAMAHAYVFAEAADVTLLIVRWAHTRPRAVLYGLRQLRLLGCNVSGIILSMVNLDKSQQYQYGDSSYYSKESRKYYART